MAAIWELYDRNTDLASYYTELLGLDSEPNSNVKVTAQLTHDILTPFTLDKRGLPRGENEPGSPAVAHYKSYQLFTLRTRLSPTIHSVYPNLEPRYDQVDVDGVRRVAVVLRDGATFVPTSVGDQSWISDLVREALTFEPDYALLIHDTRDIRHDGTLLESSWLRSILPLVPMPETLHYEDDDLRDVRDIIRDIDGEYQQSEESYDAFYHQGAIYVRFDSDRNYIAAWNHLHLQLLQILVDMHRSGTLLLDPRRDVDFITRWDLTEMPGQDPPTESDVRRLYVPTWSSPWFGIGRDLTSFLLDRYRSGGKVAVNVGPNYVTRHFLSLTAMVKVFHDGTALVEMRDVEEAMGKLDQLRNASVGASGVVVLLDTDDDLQQAEEVATFRVVGEGTVHTSVASRAREKVPTWS